MAGDTPAWITDLDVPDDVVESTRRRLTGRQRAWIAAALAVVLALGAALWAADRQRRQSEFSALLGCVVSAESARADAEARVTSMVSYVRPSIGVAPQPSVDRQLYRLVADQAATGVDEVSQAVGTCRSVAIWPIHPSLKSARSAYLLAATSERNRIESIAADGSRAFDSSDALNALRHNAIQDLSAAAPTSSDRTKVARLKG